MLPSKLFFNLLNLSNASWTHEEDSVLNGQRLQMFLAIRKRAESTGRSTSNVFVFLQTLNAFVAKAAIQALGVPLLWTIRHLTARHLRLAYSYSLHAAAAPFVLCSSFAIQHLPPMVIKIPQLNLAHFLHRFKRVWLLCPLRLDSLLYLFNFFNFFLPLSFHNFAHLLFFGNA